eukprot:366290-Chlamydomonas_euryale.AAC.5
MPAQYSAQRVGFACLAHHVDRRLVSRVLVTFAEPPAMAVYTACFGAYASASRCITSSSTLNVKSHATSAGRIQEDMNINHYPLFGTPCQRVDHPSTRPPLWRLQATPPSLVRRAVRWQRVVEVLVSWWEDCKSWVVGGWVSGWG